MVKLGEMSEEPGKGGKMDAEISAAAGTLFTVAAVAAVLSFGGGPAGAGSAAHQQAPVSGAAGGTGAGVLLRFAPALGGSCGHYGRLYGAAPCPACPGIYLQPAGVAGVQPERRGAALSADQSPYADPQEVCRFIAALGGPENIAQLGNCFTRLRLTVRDASLLDMGTLLSLPHKGLVVQGTRVQLVCGLHAAQLRHALEQQLAEMAPV